MDTKQILKKLDEIKDLIQEKNDGLKWTKIGNLEWSEDLGEMDWYAATKKCKELGGRLPTRVELLDLADNHSSECEHFTRGNYWSSFEVNAGIAWRQSFSDGTQVSNGKNNRYYVRCVRGEVGK